MMIIIVVCIALTLIGIILIPNSSAQEAVIPSWIKNNAGWWADDQIPDSAFLQGIQFLIKEGIMVIPSTETISSSSSQEVPAWIKNNAGWWADDAISETEFLNAIAYLVKVGIISIESSKSPELIAEMWVNGDINDDEFLAGVDYLIETGNIVIQDNTITKTSQLPDWLVNNAGWWAARIFTESDFTTFNTSYIYEQATRCNECIETINNHGFRGEEFSKEKSDNMFRIFAVGGSTTFGVGVNDNETWPVYLQQKFDQIELGVEVEIINSGTGNANTRSEVNLIKDKILFLNPDLIIMYDGWNDGNIPIDETIENWKSVCKLGKDNEFETIIAVQPIAGTGNRVLTEQELLNFYTYNDNGRLTNHSVDEVKKLSSYPERFDELNKHCYKTVNHMYIFDFISEPIYYDTGHTIPLGNKIIAENLYPLIKSLILENTAETFSKSGINHSLTISDGANNSRVFGAKANLSEKNFVDLDLRGAIFFKANLRNANFNGANLEGVDFRSTDLTGASFNNANLNNALFSFAKLEGIDISQESFSNVDLSKMDLRNADISNVDLSNRDLSYTNLSNQNLKNYDLSNTNLKGTDLSYTILPNDLSGHDFRSAKFYGTNLTGRNFSESDMSFAIFDNADLTEANFYRATILDSDFSKIKNKSIAGSDLSSASFAYSNLSGVNLDGTTLHATNFHRADLSGQDFTGTDSITGGLSFVDANLSNSNFESVDLSPKALYKKVFENKAYLISGGTIVTPEVELMVKEELFGKFSLELILSAEVSGNDLAVNYVFFNSFALANLENANFKNAKLWHANFYQANLTNADLSGSDLRKAFLGGADLTNANLSGANLSDVVLDENTNLNCKNHTICNS